MLDLKIVGGTIVDGSGADRFAGDIGLKDGRIVAVGEVAEEARETIDARGRIVSPGFIDVHTHYDAQVFWDPQLSPSCYHGVTTIMGGFCGFSIAPLSPEAAGYLAPMLARVEGMPLESLQAGVPWNWRSFGEYLASIDGKVGLNAGFFAGHSAIRRVVMGERAVGEKCTPQELEQMKDLLGQSLAEGAMGFSTTISASHTDGDGNPVPSRWAEHSEIIELGRVVSQHEGTGLELLPDVDFGPGVPELLADLSIAGNRPVNWNVLVVIGHSGNRERAARQLAVTDYARSRGGEVIALTMPMTPESSANFATGGAFEGNPGQWRELFKMPLDQRRAAMRDPAFRQALRDDLATVDMSAIMAYTARIGEFFIRGVSAEKNRKYVDRLVGDIAREEGRDPLDVMLDIALDDDLQANFAPNFGGYDHDAYVLRGELWRDDRTLIGASDAGAHVDRLDAFAITTTVLQKGVREHGVVTLEEAVYQMTGRAARYYGLIDRGLIRQGHHGDIVVFDEATVGRGPTYARHDLPCDQMRLYADAIGIDHVLVNGVEIVRHGEHTGKLPGKVLRSGKDSRSVPLDAMREARGVGLATA
jgi:N-acyl-D-aspartate/D-glutamate deacylase